MRYIGGKSLLLDNIQSVIDTYANDVDTITDLYFWLSSNTIPLHYAKGSNSRCAKLH